MTSGLRPLYNPPHALQIDWSGVEGENMPHPILSLLRDEEDLTSTLTVSVKYDGENDRFHVGVNSLDNRRRAMASTWVEVPKGGDLCEIGGVLNDLATAWLMAPNFVPGLVLRVAVLDHFAAGQ